jgi:hypothetical protein
VELRQAKIHSQRADNVGHRLSKRFGHPALTQELLTPMLHASMSHLLPQVYSGKIENDQKSPGEYGGQKIDTRVIEGIRIAAIDQVRTSYWATQDIADRSWMFQRDLEYDPVFISIPTNYLKRLLQGNKWQKGA